MEFVKGGIIGDSRISESQMGCLARGSVLTYTRDELCIPFKQDVVEYGTDKANVQERYKERSREFAELHLTSFDHILNQPMINGIMMPELMNLDPLFLIRLGLYVGRGEVEKIRKMHEEFIFDRTLLKWEEVWEKIK